MDRASFHIKEGDRDDGDASGRSQKLRGSFDPRRPIEMTKNVKCIQLLRMSPMHHRHRRHLRRHGNQALHNKTRFLPLPIDCNFRFCTSRAIVPVACMRH